jgi:UDP-N-acetylglucosamine 2-epimerase (non-hydrolysing)
MKIISVVGARPNFIKMAPINKAFQKYLVNNPALSIGHKICHTGQHYDAKMSDIFFDDLELPQPDYYLGAGSGSHAEQTAKIMIEFEKVLLAERPSLILVYGDVNSTVACSLVASKMGIKIAHVESGLRSFDRTMPEEINRILTDHLSDYLFVTEQSGINNLNKEGISGDNIFLAGNTMIDSLVSYLPKASLSRILDTFKIYDTRFILITLHRPSNVDDKDNVTQIIYLLNQLAELRKIIFPVHPRTKLNIQKNNLELNPNLILTDPVGYIDFLALMKNAEVVITDSGGIQEETTFLNVQCITIRDNTERPCTIEIGTNHLVGRNLTAAKKAILKVLNGEIKSGKIPALWDGYAGERIVAILVSKLSENVQ